MAKRIIWSERGRKDRKKILQYWKERNQSNVYSLKLDNLFKEAVKTISIFPKIGREIGYKNTRIKTVRDYSIVYKEFENNISIISIWDGRQDPAKFSQIINQP